MGGHPIREFKKNVNSPLNVRLSKMAFGNWQILPAKFYFVDLFVRCLIVLKISAAVSWTAWTSITDSSSRWKRHISPTPHHRDVRHEYSCRGLGPELGWEIIKEKKKVRKLTLVQENMHVSTKKRTRSRKHTLDQESVLEKKNLFKETRTWSRKHPRKKKKFWVRRNINQFYFQQLCNNLSIRLSKITWIFFLFSWTRSFFVDAFLDECVFSWTSSFFRGRSLCWVRVFLREFFFSWTRAWFLDRLPFFLTEWLLSFSLSFFYYKFPALSRNLERKERCTPSSLAGSWCPCRGPGGKGLT